MRAGRGDARGSTSRAARRGQSARLGRCERRLRALQQRTPQPLAPSDGVSIREPRRPARRWLPGHVAMATAAGGLAGWFPSGMGVSFQFRVYTWCFYGSSRGGGGSPGTRGFVPLPPWPPCSEGIAL